jgi:hypothetical protein
MKSSQARTAGQWARDRQRAACSRSALAAALGILICLPTTAKAADAFQMPSVRQAGRPKQEANPPQPLVHKALAGLGNKVAGELRPGHLRGPESPAVQQIPTAPPAKSRVMTANLQVPEVALPPAPEIIAPKEAPKAVEISVPLSNGEGAGKIEMAMKNDRISLMVRDAPISTVLGVLAQQHGLNIVTAEDVNGVISVTLHDVSLDASGQHHCRDEHQCKDVCATDGAGAGNAGFSAELSGCCRCRRGDQAALVSGWEIDHHRFESARSAEDA